MYKKQLRQIKLGMDENLDVSIYAKEYFDEDQMRQIRFGLLKNIDVSIYAHEYFDSNQMYYIRIGLLENKCVNLYALPKLSSSEMEVIYNVMDIYLYNSISYDIDNFIKFYIEVLKRNNISYDEKYIVSCIQKIKNNLQNRVKLNDRKEYVKKRR